MSHPAYNHGAGQETGVVVEQLKWSNLDLLAVSNPAHNHNHGTGEEAGVVVEQLGWQYCDLRVVEHTVLDNVTVLETGIDFPETDGNFAHDQRTGQYVGSKGQPCGPNYRLPEAVEGFEQGLGASQ